MYLTKKIIYSNLLIVENLRNNHYKFDAKILTIGYKHKFLWFTWYTIKQFIPYIDKPFYDYEFDSNTILKTRATEEYAKAKYEMESQKT